MRLIKFFIIFGLIVIASYSAAWFYAVNKLTSEVNEQYAGKQLYAKGARGEEYYAMFEQAVPTGFPFMVAAKITGWKEESRSANFTYSAPIIVGYNIITQNIFASFDGEIKATYKPASNGFGANLKIHDYKILADFPLSKKVMSTISKKGDPYELINYLGDITISTGKVEIFDLIDGAKFYDKQYEILNLSFTPAKYYQNLEDFLSNIPKEYNAKYQVKTNALDQESRRVPVSLFYGFFTYPSGFTADGTATVKTNSKTFKDISKDIDLKSTISFSSHLIDMPSYDLTYKGSAQGADVAFKLASSLKIKIKDGFFDELFRHYGVIHPHLVKLPLGVILDRELSYIISNKNAFRFKDLENSDYNLNLDLDCAQGKSRQYLNIRDFSIFSDKSGIRLKHESENKHKGQSTWIAKGILFVNNYPEVTDFLSGYIYRFGKFKNLSEEARKLYVEANNSFLKSISDHPESKSRDLSFTYDIDSKDMSGIKIGTAQFANIGELYQLTIYHKLLDKVGLSGDVIGNMKKIIPDLDENSKFLKEVLPKITTGKEAGAGILEKLGNVIPK